MLELSHLNVFAIIVTWLLNVVVGAYWYSPKGFGMQWSKLSGVDIMKIPKDEANRAILAVAIASLVQAVVLAVILRSLHVETIGNALLISSILWAGFTAATTVGVTLYSRLRWKFWWLNSSFFLLVMIINALILTIWV